MDGCHLVKHEGCQWDPGCEESWHFLKGSRGESSSEEPLYFQQGKEPICLARQLCVCSSWKIGNKRNWLYCICVGPIHLWKWGHFFKSHSWEIASLWWKSKETVFREVGRCSGATIRYFGLGFTSRWAGWTIGASQMQAEILESRSANMWAKHLNPCLKRRVNFGFLNTITDKQHKRKLPLLEHARQRSECRKGNSDL